MPVEIEKEEVTTSSGPVSDHVSQTSSTVHAPTHGEMKDAQSDRGNAWVWYIVGIIDLLLALRIVFHLFGARAVGFADMLYQITGFFTAPFKGIFPNPTVDGSYFDTSALVAIAVYALVGWAVSRLVDLLTRPATSKKI